MSLGPRIFIIFYFLLWNVLSSSTATIHDESFQNPPLNSDTTILKIHSDSLGTALESEVNTKFFDGRSKRSMENGPDGALIVSLNKYYNSLDTQLKALQESIGKSCEAEVPIPARVVKAIQTHRFPAAQVLLETIDYKNVLYKIIHDVYANPTTNTSILMNFSKSVGNIGIRLYVYKALHYEMRANGDRDPHKLITLKNAVVVEVIKQKKNSPDIMTEALNLYNELAADIKDGTTEILKTAVYAGNYEQNVQVKKLMESLAYFNSDDTDEVMQRLVNEVFFRFTTKQLADMIVKGSGYVSPVIAGLVALYNKLASNNQLNDPAFSTIKGYLGQCQRTPGYNNLSEKQRTAVTKIMAS